MVQSVSIQPSPRYRAATPAERMQAMRQRRKDGKELTPPLEVSKPEIKLLTKWGYLPVDKKTANGNFKEELEQALYRFFDDAFPALEKIRIGSSKA